MGTPLIILTKKQVQQKIDRIAYQILEDTVEESDYILAGIAERGYTLATRIYKVLTHLSDKTIVLIKIELDKNSSSLKASSDKDIGLCENKTVVVIDDVLNTGKSLAYGVGFFLNIPLKKLRTAVLVNRSHKLFPVESDFTGYEISTTLREHVSVILDQEDQEDGVFLQ